MHYNFHYFYRETAVRDTLSNTSLRTSFCCNALGSMLCHCHTSRIARPEMEQKQKK